MNDGVYHVEKSTHLEKSRIFSVLLCFLIPVSLYFLFFSHSLSHSRIAKHLQEDRRKEGQEICLSLETELCLTSLSKHS